MSAQTTEPKSAEAPKEVSQEALLKLSKEIAVKFIEVGRITPSTFDACFKDIYTTLESTIRRS